MGPYDIDRTALLRVTVDVDANEDTSAPHHPGEIRAACSGGSAPLRRGKRSATRERAPLAARASLWPALSPATPGRLFTMLTGLDAPDCLPRS